MNASPNQNSERGATRSPVENDTGDAAITRDRGVTSRARSSASSQVAGGQTCGCPRELPATTALASPARCLPLIAALSCLYFFPIFLHPGEVLFSGHNNHNDFLRLAYPWRYYAVSQAQDGSLPLWLPASMAGVPFEADCQTQMFYPPYAVFYMAPLTWLLPLFGFVLWAHVLLAGLLMFAYARYRRLTPLASLVAAAGFMFAGKWLIHILESGHYAFLPVAWFPLLLYWAELAIERRSLRYIAGVGMLGAVIFTGSHPQMTLYMGFLACLLSLRPVFGSATLAAAGERSRAFSTGETSESATGTAPSTSSAPSILNRIDAPHAGNRPAEVLSDRTSRAGRFRWWMFTWIAAGCLATGLTAIQLLPTLELVGYTTRAQQITAHHAEGFDLVVHGAKDVIKRFLSLLGPQNFGGTPSETVGALGVLWAGVALITMVLDRRPAFRVYGGILLLMVLFALNSSTPVYPVLRRLIPGFALFRIPTRFLMLAGFPLGMLAGSLTQRLFESGQQCRTACRQAAVVLAGLAVGFLILSLASRLFGKLPDSAPLPPYWKWLLAVAPGAIAVLLWRSRRTTGSRFTAAAWLALLAADLWGLHWQYVVTQPPADVFPETDLVRFVRAHPGDYRIMQRALGEQSSSAAAITQGLCIMHGLECVTGYNPTDLGTFRQFLHFIAGRDDPPNLDEVITIPPECNQQLLDLLGARYLVGPAADGLTPAESQNWRHVATLTDNRTLTERGMVDLPPQNVYERIAPLPRAFVVDSARRTPPHSELLQALQKADLRTSVFLDSPKSRFQSLPEPLAESRPEGVFQEARIVSREPERIVVEVEREAPGYLVLLDAWYPGWRCRTAEGRELPIWRANSLFRAIPVAAGKQTLEFTFAPPVYELGRLVSLVSLAGVVGFLAVSGFAAQRRRYVVSSGK